MSRSSEKINNSFITVLVIFIITIIGLPFILNIENFMGIYNYDSSKKYSTNLDNGSGYLNVNLRFAHMNGDSFNVFLSTNVYSSGDVEVIGISNITINIRVENGFIYTLNENYTQPVKSLSKRITTSIVSQQTVYSNGTITVKFNESNTIKTVLMNYSISHKLLISPDLITYHITYPLFWLRLIYFGIMIILVFLLVRYGRPYFSKVSNYPEDIKKRDELFVKYLHERNRELAGEDEEENDKEED